MQKLVFAKQTAKIATSVLCRRGYARATTGPLTRLSEDEQLTQEMVSKFADTVIKPKVKEMDEKAHMDPQVIKACFDQGLLGIGIPEKYGGGSMSFMNQILVIEELAKVDPAVSVMVDVQNTLVNQIFNTYASDRLKQLWLPRLAKDSLGSFCLSEAGSGSDAFALQCRAQDNGDHFVLNGSKCWITNAKEAAVFIVMANVNPAAGYKGITAFVVDAKNPGLHVGKKEDKLGIRASSTCVVNLEDCRVNKEDVLGEVGKGYKIAINTLNEGRIGIGAQMLGLAQGVYDCTLPYLQQRKQFGHPIANFQGMMFQYADAAVEIQAARLLVYEAARLQEAGVPFTKEASMCKYYASEMASRVATRCVEWMGGNGFTKEFPVEKFYRDCIVGKIYEGTSNMNLQTIAKFVQEEYRSKKQ